MSDRLNISLQVFEKPLLESLVLTVDEVDKIFVNWRDIIACNDNFLRYDIIIRYIQKIIIH